MALDTRSEKDGRSDTTFVAQESVIRLLCRAATRLAVAAQGVDPRLDDMLAELRQLLRRELSETGALAVLIDNIDDRIKHVDDEREQRMAVLQRDLHQLAEQLLTLNPSRENRAALKSFQKNLKQRVAGGTDFSFITDLSTLQAQILEGDADARPGLFARWRGRRHNEQDSATEVDDERFAATDQDRETEALTGNDDSTSEQPFSRISAAVCQVLAELLRSIEPPPRAGEHHRRASAQIEKGLNWYELVSTLEEISLIVQAALERGQDEIRQFLVGLNQRLLDADQTLQVSRRHQQERRQSDAALNQVVRLEVAEMQAKVAEATELDQLKTEVASRLESVVGAMDRHQQSEQVRQRELEQELDTLTARMRDMEAQTALIEQRLIEQRRLALLDPLTQLPNRQAYDERLQQEYQRWLRYGRSLTLAVCDIDHFKSINDNYGHLAGDKVLRIIAKALRGRLRQADFIARFGGEEFVILMPETAAQDALHALDAVRLAVAQCPFHFREQPVTITLSFGIAVFSGDLSPDVVFERADTALYRAKQAGRNRCVLDETSA